LRKYLIGTSSLQKRLFLQTTFLSMGTIGCDFMTIRRKPELALKAVGGITGEVTGEVQRLLAVMTGEMKRSDLQAALALRHEDYFRETYLNGN
jgi:hypothetical protein